MRFLAKLATLSRERTLFAVLIGALILAYALGGLAGLDNLLTSSRFKLARTDASQNLVLIEIDTSSIETLDAWPWARSVHAGMIERLGEAGVREIALNLDFSARSTAEDDDLLARALATAERPVILPVYRQISSRAGTAAHIVMKGPIPSLRDNALPGSVNVIADSDGMIRRHAMGEQWQGHFVPSLAALLAGAAQAEGSEFHVDYGIRAKTIPAYSYADLYLGRADLAPLAGKSVLIGASAAELGANFTIPHYGTVPGILLHAMAYESIAQDRMLKPFPVAAVAVIGLVLGFAFLVLFGTGDWRRGSLILVLGIAVIYGVTLAIQAWTPALIGGGYWMLCLLAAYLSAMALGSDRQAFRVFLQGMAIQHRRNMMDAVLEKNFHGIVITDGRGQVQFVNEAAERILDISGDGALHSPITEILPGADKPDSSADEPPVMELELSRGDGEEVSLELVVSQSSVGIGKSPFERRAEARSVRVYTFRDIGQRKLLEKAQHQALEEAVSAGRSKAEFLAIMSHELRTPLNAIIGFSEILKNQIFGPIGNAQYLEYAEDIHRSGGSLLTLINDILDVSRVEAGKFNIHDAEVKISALIESSMKLVRNSAADQDIALKLDIPDSLPRLKADERLLMQMMINILSNAVKFSKENGEIRVRAFIDDGGSYVIETADSGIGIAKDDIQKVLMPFQQADGSLGRKYEGSGLGLYLVSKFIDLHDGELSIESEPGEGTVVSLKFPPKRVARDTGDGKQAAN